MLAEDRRFMFWDVEPERFWTRRHQAEQVERWGANLKIGYVCFLKGKDFYSLHHQFSGHWSQVNITQESYLKRLSRGNWFSAGKRSIGFGIWSLLLGKAHMSTTLSLLATFFYQNFSASHFSTNGQLRTTWYFRKFFNMKGRYQDKPGGKRNIEETKKKKAQKLWLTF